MLIDFAVWVFVLGIVSQSLLSEIGTDREDLHERGTFVIDAFWIVQNRKIQRREADTSCPESQYDRAGLKCWWQALDDIWASDVDSRSLAPDVGKMSIAKTGEAIQNRFGAVRSYD